MKDGKTHLPAEAVSDGIDGIVADSINIRHGTQKLSEYLAGQSDEIKILAQEVQELDIYVDGGYAGSQYGGMPIIDFGNA